MATPTDDDRTLLTVIASMTARPGKEAELREALEGLVAPTTAEDGNVNYDLHVSVEDPATFFLYENWTGPEKLKAHFDMPYLKELVGRVDDLTVDGLHVTTLQRIK